MAVLERMPAAEAEHLLNLDCPSFETTPWVKPPPLAKSKLALISTAGLHRRGETAFDNGSADYRIIPADTPASEIVMSHVSTNYDRTGFQQDINVVFPLELLRGLVELGVIGSLAQYHYSFMGATHPDDMVDSARALAKIMKAEGVDSVLLVPV